MKALARKGVKRMAVLTPGFSVDCLETLSEIGVENREFFIENGGESFALIPCLNDSALGMRVIEAIVARELLGWVGRMGKGFLSRRKASASYSNPFEAADPKIHSAEMAVKSLKVSSSGSNFSTRLSAEVGSGTA